MLHAALPEVLAGLSGRGLEAEGALLVLQKGRALFKCSLCYVMTKPILTFLSLTLSMKNLPLK